VFHPKHILPGSLSGLSGGSGGSSSTINDLTSDHSDSVPSNFTALTLQ